MGLEGHQDVRIPHNMHIVNLINSEISASYNKHEDDDNDDDKYDDDNNNNNNNLQVFLESNSAFLLTNTRYAFISFACNTIRNATFRKFSFKGQKDSLGSAGEANYSSNGWYCNKDESVDSSVATNAIYWSYRP
jgi:hypothetical protein